jgi:hypothetical protein
MSATNDELIDIESIAERFRVDKRTVERLIEKYAKKLTKNRRSQSRKILYRWADVLMCAKIHTGVEVEKENVSRVILTACLQRENEEHLTDIRGKNRKGFVRVCARSKDYFPQIRVCPIDND